VEFSEIEAVIFDLGGTLIGDPYPVARPAIGEQLLRDEVISPSQQPSFERALEKTYTEMIKEDPPFASFYMGEPELIRRALAEIGASASNTQIEKVLDFYRRRAVSVWISNSNWYGLPPPQLKILLSDLRKGGIKLGLLSNERERFFNTVYYPLLGIDRRDFDYSTCSEKLGFGKPDPRAFQAVLESLSVPPGKAVYIGDMMVRDIIPAKKLGMISILTIQFSGLLSSGLLDEARPDIIIKYLGEIRDLLGLAVSEN
jgi:FMN phosphatase YigB (HAD superfamily)